MTYLARWCYLTFLFAVFGACYHCYLLSLVFAAVDSPDRTFVLEALQRQPSLFCNCDIGGFQEDRDVVLAAVRGNFQCFLFTKQRFRDDREIVLAAPRQDTRAFEYGGTSA